MTLAFVIYFLDVILAWATPLGVVGSIVLIIGMVLKYLVPALTGISEAGIRIGAYRLTEDCRFGKAGQMVTVRRIDSDGEVFFTDGKGENHRGFGFGHEILAVSTLAQPQGKSSTPTLSGGPLIKFGAIALAVCLLLPPKDTAMHMLAAYGVQEVVTNPEVQKFAGNSMKVLEKAMADYLKEEGETPVKQEEQPQQVAEEAAPAKVEEAKATDSVLSDENIEKATQKVVKVVEAGKAIQAAVQ